jgi:DNA helicase IV
VGVRLSSAAHERELSAERDHVAFLHTVLDERKTAASAGLARALRDGSSVDPEARWAREVAVRELSTQVNGLRAAEAGLCFGRLDRLADESTYIGRIGLFDENDGYLPLLLDWRAPAARPFYCATAANPEGVRRRRQFRTRGRELLDFHDEALDAGSATESAGSRALLAALDAPRDENMHDIVATIQADQDEIIRLDCSGVVVIEGGPGTGKTAVALHRVAYLLYTQRDRLSRRGVLIVGPNTGFLRYIGDVLPSLGETDVVFATPGELVPGLAVVREDLPRARRVKGGLVMLEVLAATVADRQRVPDEPIPIGLADVTVVVDAEVAGAARERARHSGLPHNPARAVFVEELISALAGRAVRRIGAGWLRPGESPELTADLTADVRAELAAHPRLAAVLDELWPVLTPMRLLSDLYASPARLDTAAAMLDEADRAALFRAPRADWTVSDVPLLDEAVDLLGPAAPVDAAEARRRQDRLDYAAGVLQVLDTDEDPDGEQLRAVDLVDAQWLAERQAEGDHRDLAERAAADRDWTYGHVVVDEAQELSEMDWRLLMRRCPSRSFTIVGDLAQRQSPAGARSWSEMLDWYVPGRWIYRALTVNYRTPAEIMAVAADVLAELDPAGRPPVSVRDSGRWPWARRVRPDDLAAVARAAVLAEFDRLAGGSLVVIAPPATAGSIGELGAPVLTPREVKGLEFDSVLLLEPQRTLADPGCGAAELYVALTRATQWLGVLHTEPLPAVLRRLSAMESVGG